MIIIQVDELEWDEDNETHCLEHGLDPWIADEVRTGAPLFFRNRPGRAASWLMIGPDRDGIFWTIALLETEVEGRWYPITGWESDKNEISRYSGNKRKSYRP